MFEKGQPGMVGLSGLRVQFKVLIFDFRVLNRLNHSAVKAMV